MSFNVRFHWMIGGAAAVLLFAGASLTAEAKPRRKNAAVQPAAAVTGLAASHDMRREGGRLCFSDHYHHGSSSAQPNQRAAQAQAARTWAEFTDLEYGSAWANYARASGKDMKCAESSAGWGCELSARPCR